jgi:ubiquinone/menaquinone biosynthesis C-methylase UbiE
MNHEQNIAVKSREYWTDHNVTLHKIFETSEESLDYFHWRNDQYIDYIKLLPVAGHDDEVIVDYGCGPGHDLVGFLLDSKPSLVHGIDVSSSSLAEARARLRVHGLECRLQQIPETDPTIPLETNSVDYVHCSGVLMVLPSPGRTLAEFLRVLKPGGYARLMVYNYDSLWLHLYVAHILPTTDERYQGLTLEEAFQRSTDGFECPISQCWTIEQMLTMGQAVGFETKHLGNAVSLFEMSLLPQRFAPLMNAAFRKESRDFLSTLTFDNRGVPYNNGNVAGIDGCYEFRKPG